jgi:hypothetical protein|tara:strand:- start:73 stop:339 length:267 start_codon:yes stop_codon:yes gene_type:complete
MPKQSARQYYDELSDLVFGEEGNSKRANKIYDILEKRGYESWQIDQNIAAGLGLPDKEEFKKGGYIKRQSGGQIGKPRGWGAARYGNN